MAEPIVIPIIGKDQASASLRAVRGQVVGLGDDADKTDGLLGKLGGAVGKLGGFALTAGLAVATTAFVGFGAALASGVQDARAAAQVMAQTEAVIKSTGGAAGFTADQISDMAASLSAAEGKSLFGDDDIQKGQNLLLTFTNIKETLPDATQTMLDMAQALGTDASGSAIQLGKALNDPVEGISALTRVGVTFTDQQKSQIEAMVAAGDTAGAQKVILAELNKEFGGSAEAAAKADGGWAQLNDRWGEAKETMGAAVLPLLTTLAGVLNDEVLPVVESAAAAFAAWLSDPATQQGIQAIGDAIMTGLAVAFEWLTTTGIPALLEVWALLQPAIETVIGLFTSGELSGALTETGGTFQAVASTIQAVLDGIVAIVAAQLAQLTLFWHTHGDEIMAFMQQTWAQINTIIQLAMQLINATIVPALQLIAQFITDHSEEIQTILGAVWQAISAIISGTLNTIQGIITAVLAAINGDWDGFWTAIQGIADAQMATLKEVFSAGLIIIQTLFTDIWEEIKLYFQGIMDSLVGWAVQTWEGLKNSIIEASGMLRTAAGQVADAIISGITSGITEGASRIASAAKDAALSALDAAKSALGISSPSTEFAEVGEDSGAGYIVGLYNMLPQMLAAVATMGDELIKEAEQVATKVADALADAFDASANIDRQRAKNLDSLAKLGAEMQKVAQEELAKAEAAAARIADPTERAQFFKQRSQQIFELAGMRDQMAKNSAAIALNETRVLDAEGLAEQERLRAANALLAQKIMLIEQAQAAEQQALAVRQAASVDPMTQIGQALGGLSASGVPGVPGMPGTGAMAGAMGQGLTLSSGAIVINAAAGMNEQMIAERVMAEIERRMQSRFA